MPHVPCAICGGTDVVEVARARSSSAIVRCRRDGLLYASPRPARARIEQTFDTWAWTLGDRLPARLAALQREATAIQTLKSGGVLLDVGCATGLFFRFFPGPQWQLCGVEPSRQAATYAAEHSGADVVCGFLGDGPWGPRTFDVISIIDTFYYLPDPASSLAEVRRLLKDDGILAVEIPGYAYRMLRERGPLCWLMDGVWRRMTPGRQLYFYSPRTLTTLLQQSGFEVVRLVPQPAPSRASSAANAVIAMHLAAAGLVSWGTRGRASIAAKELYLCRKA